MDRKNRDPFKEILFDNEFEAPGFPHWGSLPEKAERKLNWKSILLLFKRAISRLGFNCHH